MHSLKYILYREGDYYVSQCLNVEVSSFSTSVKESIDNLKEAVELYFEYNQDYRKTMFKRYTTVCA